MQHLCLDQLDDADQRKLQACRYHQGGRDRRERQVKYMTDHFPHAQK
jgi:hypothetical protein